MPTRSMAPKINSLFTCTCVDTPYGSAYAETEIAMHGNVAYIGADACFVPALTHRLGPTTK